MKTKEYFYIITLQMHINKQGLFRDKSRSLTSSFNGIVTDEYNSSSEQLFHHLVRNSQNNMSTLANDSNTTVLFYHIEEIK